MSAQSLAHISASLWNARLVLRVSTLLFAAAAVDDDDYDDERKRAEVDRLICITSSFCFYA